MFIRTACWISLLISALAASVRAVPSGDVLVAGTGLMWGLLATLSDDGGVTVSPRMNP